jgi:hypothetical protein
VASLTKESELAAWIDHSLKYLIAEWSDIPVVAAGWDTWEEPDRLDFVLEWPLREMRLDELRHWQAEGRLTALQQIRFEELERLIQCNRPTVDRLLAE